MLLTRDLKASNGIFPIGAISIPRWWSPAWRIAKELADTIHIIERGGIKVALLNYTQHTNGIPRRIALLGALRNCTRVICPAMSSERARQAPTL